MKRLLIVAVALLGRRLYLVVFALPVAAALFSGVQIAKSQPRTPSYSLPPDIGTQWQPGLTYNGGIPSANWYVYSPSYTCTNTTGPSGDLATIQQYVNNVHSYC